ncbi:ricin B lectin domain-containing protein [Mycena haematopus]|nr:ricin B lectin domain-containing protein [Mycena haematopus]
MSTKVFSRNTYHPTQAPPRLEAVCVAMKAVSRSAMIFSAVDSGLCITVAEDVDGAPLVVQPCSTMASPNQEWQLNLFSEENSAPAPMVVLGDKCVDVTGGADQNGTPLQVWTCGDGNPNQQWISVTDGSFQWSGTDKCMDLTGGNTASGTVLQIWTCGPSANINQGWSRQAPAPSTKFGLFFVGFSSY